MPKAGKRANDSILFGAAGYKFGLLPGFSKQTSTHNTSVHNDTGKPATLYRPALKAYALYCCDGRRVYDYKSYNSQEIYAEQIGYGGALGHLGGDGNDLYVAEYRQTESTLHVACFDVKKRQFLFAGTTEDGGETFKPYVLDYKEGRNGTVLWLALMPYLADNSSEIRDVFDHNETVSKAYKELVEGVIAELPKEAQKQGFLFCDSIYYTANRIGAPMEIEVNVPGAGVFPTVPNVIEKGVYKPEDVLVGKFFTKGLTDEKPKKKVMPEVAPSELKCKYTLNPNMSELEKASVHQMPDTYIVTPLLLKAVHNVWFHHQNQKAEKGVAPKNILLIGPPGSGKSEFAKAMASGLGLKATHVSLSANSDESFATGAFTPQVDDICQSASVNLFDDVLSKYQNIADLLDCAEMAPDVVYADITGKEKPDAAISDCVEAYSDLKAKAETEKVLLMEKESGHSSGISYTFVESKFAQAIENGWLVTLEEFTNVRDSAVAILINQLMDGYQELTLPTGKVIHRHPNAVVVFACNTDENQTGELQASTLSRLTTKYYIDFPNQAEMIRRVRNITGFDDEAALQQMASVVVTLRDYIDEHGFNGVCGVREFAGWAMQYQASLAFDADSTLREAAMETIVPSASTHREEMDEVIKDVIDTMLAA